MAVGVQERCNIAGLLLNSLSVIRGLELMFDSFETPDKAAEKPTAALPDCLVSLPCIQYLLMFNAADTEEARSTAPGY